MMIDETNYSIEDLNDMELSHFKMLVSFCDQNQIANLLHRITDDIKYIYLLSINNRA